MKILFLDMDGVLNSHAFMLERAEARKWEPEPGPLPPGFNMKAPEHWVRMVDKKAVERLNRILDETDAKVVISSSWRHAHPHPTGRMQKILDLCGFKGEVIDETPVMSGPRSFEISSWLAAHPIASRFVILDDGASAGDGLTKWFVHTDLAHGLQDADVKKAINILGRR